MYKFGGIQNHTNFIGIKWRKRDKKLDNIMKVNI